MTFAEATSEKKCTLAELTKIIRETSPAANGENHKPTKTVSPVAVPSPWAMVISTLNDFDEICPGLYLGGQSLARDKGELKRLGITHIVNTAQGEKYNQIDTNEKYYADLSLHFFGIPAQDVAGFKMSEYFCPAAKYIHDALENGGKVYVHCHQGISRSATVVMAYLMLYQGVTAMEAAVILRKKRGVFPNDGFLRQLCDLNNGLFAEEEQDTNQNKEVETETLVKQNMTEQTPAH